jgi:hypothetical protein
MAPERRIARRPHRSTRYHLREKSVSIKSRKLSSQATYVGIVEAMYTIELIPVIRIAFRPTHPASVDNVE